MGSSHLSSMLAVLHQAARSWHCQGGMAPRCRAGLVFFFNFPLLKKQQTFPARFATGIIPATWLEQCQEQILLWELIVIRNVNRHREKPLRSGSSQCRAVQAAAPELPAAMGSKRPQGRGEWSTDGEGLCILRSCL